MSKIKTYRKIGSKIDISKFWQQIFLGLTIGQVMGGQAIALVGVALIPPLILAQPPLLKPPQSLGQGSVVIVNGKSFSVAWSQWKIDDVGGIHTGIADVGLLKIIGIDLLSNDDIYQQPIQWFSGDESMTLSASLDGQYRYLDITDLAKTSGWEVGVDGTSLRINSPVTNLQDLQSVKEAWGQRIMVDLDRPTPWQINFLGSSVPPKSPHQPQATTATNQARTVDDESKPNQQLNEVKSDLWAIAIDAQINPPLLKRFPPIPTEENPSKKINQNYLDLSQNNPAKIPNLPLLKPTEIPVLRSLSLQSSPHQTTIRIALPPAWHPQVHTLTNPNRLVIDIRPDDLVEKNIFWAPGLHWRQNYLSLNNQDRFAVIWLEIDPHQPGISLKPIWSKPTTMIGTLPLIQIAHQWQAIAAINGGFFNRNSQQPLGALRRDRIWLSSPILNRGAIAWNDQGEFTIDRLTLQETLINSSGTKIPVISLNSAYAQNGISRYTPAWGTTYTPITNHETILSVENDRVISEQFGGEMDQKSFPIPLNGYLLIWRGKDKTNGLSIGTRLNLTSMSIPANFSRYPHILGAGPLLVKNGKIVLDAKAENFNDAYVRQTAVRSGIGKKADGTILIVAAHNRPNGAAPTFAEMAQIMQNLGAVEALNLDGGSSTSLDLGGQLINRPSAARVHNGIGVFFQP